jgi:hypothetical protein
VTGEPVCDGGLKAFSGFRPLHINLSLSALPGCRCPNLNPLIVRGREKQLTFLLKRSKLPAFPSYHDQKFQSRKRISHNSKSEFRKRTRHALRLDERMLRTLRAMARMRGEDPKAVELVPFVNHDLRRVVRSNLSALKVGDHVAEMVLGHERWVCNEYTTCTSTSARCARR